MRLLLKHEIRKPSGREQQLTRTTATEAAIHLNDERHEGTRHDRLRIVMTVGEASSALRGQPVHAHRSDDIDVLEICRSIAHGPFPINEGLSH